MQADGFGTVLRRYRGRAGLTQEALAEAAGLSVRAIQDLERGASAAPRAATMEMLIHAMRLGPDERTDLEMAARKPRPAALPTSPFFFVSCAREDRVFAEQLLVDLQGQGITGRIDAHDLKPGTAAREQALRDVLLSARAVLLAVSADSHTARHIEDVLHIAEMYHCTVHALWVAGDHWPSCAPAGWAAATHIDFRGAAYAQGFQHLIAALPGPTRHAAPTPDHGPALSEPTAPPRNPYKGLRAFTSADAQDFFGREQLIADLLAGLRAAHADAPRFLAVIGPSGSGKSSVVLAGLLPALLRGDLPGSDNWIYLDPIMPGAHPLKALTLALSRAMPGSSLAEIRDDLDDSGRGLHLLASRLARDGGGRVFLILDQYEELFTLTTDEDERQHFIDLLVTAVTEPRGPVAAAITLRADFYDRPMRYPSLVPLLERHGKLIPPMGSAELRAAIEQPAALPDVRLRFERDLVGDLLFEVRGELGALPLLQFTLDQLFARRAGRCLTVAAYQEMGGVRGALARHAETTFATLPTDAHRLLARALLLRLIDPGATEQEATRRRAGLTELELPDAQQTVVMREAADAFIAARLLITNEHAGVTTIEVSHEALIREWGRAAEWLREAREDIRRQQVISADAAEWVRLAQPADHLYRGTVLDGALAWAGRNTPSASEHAFIEAAVAERLRQETAERARHSREGETRRQAASRLRALISVLVLFLVVATGLTALAVRSAATANDAAARAARARQAALAERTLALSRQLAAQALTHLDDAPDLALLLSVAANQVGDTVEAHDSLLRALEHDPRLITFLRGQQGSVLSVAFSPDGRTLVSGGENGTIRLWDVADRRPLGRPLIGHTASVTSVVFSHDGSALASASSDRTIRFWDAATGRLAGAVPTDEPASVTNLAYSPAAPLVAFGGNDGAVRIWDVARGRLIGQPLTDHVSYPQRLAFSSGGNLLAVGATNGTIGLWDVMRRAMIGPRLGGHTAAVTAVAFNSGDTILASGSADRTIRLWDVATHHLIARLVGHTGIVTSLAFSPSGRILASSSADGTVRLWDVATGQILGAPFPGRTQAVNSVAFSPDGSILAGGNADGTIWLWAVAQEPSLGSPLAGHTDSVTGVTFSHDGRLLVSSSADQTLRLWDVADRRPMGRPLIGHTDSVTSVAFSPVNNLVASGSSDTTIRLWDAASGRTIGVLSGHTALVTSLAFSRDGRLLASGGGDTGTQTGPADGTIRLWDVTRRQILGPPLAANPSGVFSLAFNPTSSVLAAGYGDGSIRLWDMTRRQPLDLPFVGHTSSVNSVAFSPDGKILASGSADNSIRLWNVATGQQTIPPLTGHTDSVTSVTFSSGGALLASGGADGTVRLWDVVSGRPVGQPLTGHTDIVTSVAFSPDGTLLASGGADARILLWEVDRAAWTRRACREANRDLTSLEWKQYLGSESPHRVC